jgi:hypothetical protein
VTSLLALVAAGCFPPDLGDGAIACGANGACPPKYFCHSDQRCWKTPDTSGGSDMSIDGGGGAMDMTMQDLAGADLTMCMKAACGNRNCGMIPDGCGGVESCGMMCPAQQSCGGGNPGMANVCAPGKMCTPRQQCQFGSDCGLISDGCSAVLDCGMCPSPKTCGADHMCH